MADDRLSVHQLAWYSRRELRRQFCETLGLTEPERRHLYELDRPRYASEWLAAEDPSYLLPEYASEWYAANCVECFADYTLSAVRKFSVWWRQTSQEGVALDLGAGVGASTRLFEELARSEAVFHTYGEGAQLDVAMDLVGASTIAVGHQEASILEEIRPHAVMAFELFEHVRDPVRLIREIDAAGVQVLCCANSFGAEDFGHWRTYLVDGKEIPRGAMGTRFAQEMRSLGWKNQDTGFWNRRPAIWVKRERDQLALSA